MARWWVAERGGPDARRAGLAMPHSDRGAMRPEAELPFDRIDDVNARRWIIPRQIPPAPSIASRFAAVMMLALPIGATIGALRNPWSILSLGAVGFWAGWAILWSRARQAEREFNAEIEITLSRDALSLMQGPRGEVRRFDAAEIEAIVLHGLERTVAHPDDPCDLVARVGSDEYTLVLSRPAIVLAPLAREIADAMAEIAGVDGVEASWVTIEECIAGMVERPCWSRVRFEDDASGWRMVAPARGWSLKTILLCGVGVLLLAVSVAGGVFGFQLMTGTAQSPLGVAVAIALAAIMFACCAAFILGSAHQAHARTTLVCAGETLRIETAIHRLRPRRRDWPLADLAAIRRDTTSEHGDDHALAFFWRRGERTRRKFLCVGRREEELEWMAAELRARLEVPMTAD